MNYLFIFFVCFLLQFLTSFEMNFINPIIPYLSSYFGIEKSSVIYLNFGFFFVGLFSPFFGMFTDKIGKKKGLFLATLFYIIGTFLSGIAFHPYFFAFSRMITGIGSLTIGATVIAYISDFIPFSQRGKAAGSLRIAFALAIMLAPMSASYMVERFNLKTLYFIVSSMAVVVLFLLLKLPSEPITRNTNGKTIDFVMLLSLLKNRTTQKVVLISFMVMAAPLSLFGFFSIWLDQHFSLGQREIGLIYTLVNSGTMVGVAAATMLSDKIGKFITAKIGFILMAATLFPLSFLNTIPLVVIIVMINALGLDGGFLAFQTLASEVNPKQRTLFMTLISFSHSLCSLIFVVAAPLLYNMGGYRLLNFIGGTASIIAIITLYSLSRDKVVDEGVSELA
ncbi:Predicted arabinose efflux permease, MFS family [Natronincola peptidivorans]|uniref:Predicted arabinose efflux permease, MFS family n=1 Tax=Natronincola peptidivorans TaxID=426128 RepID=A0A1I0H0J3_9FIRM|nr:MFS transporter [Natronincola peptidivorans]SET77204.1 Predicted arabinose efflux permease, MFS family [Natronincola peptidivorans]